MKRLQIDPADGFRVVAGTSRSQAATMVVGPRESVGGPGNRHPNADQWLFVLSGVGLAIVGDRDVPLEAGTLLLIEAGESHEIRNEADEPLQTLNVYAPPEY